MSDMKLSAALLKSEPSLMVQQVQPATPLMSRELIDTMFVGMARCPEFFDECHRHIRPSYFPLWEGQYRVLFHVMCELRAKNHRIFNWLMLHVECYDFIASNPGVCDEQQAYQLLQKNWDGLLFHVFATPENQIDLALCRRYLQRFLTERVVATPLRQFINQVEAGSVPERLEEFLDVIQESRRRIQTVNDLPIVEVMPDPSKPIKPPAVYNMTGVSFIDGPLGGQREGDANGILGVTGSGKSTLAAYMGVQMARTEYTKAQVENRAPRLSVIFTYEESSGKMNPRIWSAAAHIKREKLERLERPHEELTHSGNLDDYELKIAGEGQDKEGEYERWVKTRGWLPHVLWVADMSGSEQFPNSGGGYVDEIVSVLEGMKIQSGGRLYLSVLIDFAGLVCSRYMQAKGMDEGRLRHLLKDFGDHCRREISERYRCTTWIFHQIAPSNATKSPTQPLHHSMASEARSFAEFLAVCGCIGVPDPNTGCRLLNWSKTRYSRTETVEPVMLRIHELFAEFENVSDMYRMDESSRTFITADEYARIHGGNGNGAGLSRSSLAQGRIRGNGSRIPSADRHISRLG